nr:MAG TPA: hypothetical protein [Caudoviricetes sp.]
MEENVKKEVQNITDEESAYPGTLSSDIIEDRIKAMMEFRKEHELESKYPPFHYGYGHMSTTQLLALVKARKSVTIPNPNVNPQWSEITDDAIKFATAICMEEDIQKIQDALHEFIDVEDSHSKFIRKALARSILKTDMRCRVKSTRIVIDEEKLKVKMDDPEDKSLKEYLNDTFGNPYKKILPNMDSNSKYVKYEGDEDK